MGKFSTRRSLRVRWVRTGFAFVLLATLFTLVLVERTARPAGSINGGLDGTFIDLSSMTAAEVPAVMAEIKAMGMDTVIVAATRQKSTDCASTAFTYTGGGLDRLDAVMAEAQARAIAVYVGLVSSGPGCPAFYDLPNRTVLAAETSSHACLLRSRYATNTRLAGWYLPDEPALGIWTQPDLTYAYYAGVVNAVNGCDPSNRPIVASPYLGGVGAKTPAEIGLRAKEFGLNTGVDIQAWQDSVSYADVHIAPATGYSLGAYFTAISAQIGSASLWSDSELFSCCVNGGGGWYTATISARLQQQIAAVAGSVSKKVSWSQPFHAGTSLANAQEGARRLKAGYLASVGLSGSLRTVSPATYTWETAPAAAYPDSGGELTNRTVGDPSVYTDSQWAGVIGTARVRIDFPRARRFDWASVHVLAAPGPGITFPSALTIECAANGNNFTTVATRSLPVPQGQGEFVLGNAQPLDVNCKSVRISLANTGWTFVSEIELVDE